MDGTLLYIFEISYFKVSQTSIGYFKHLFLCFDKKSKAESATNRDLNFGFLNFYFLIIPGKSSSTTFASSFKPVGSMIDIVTSVFLLSMIFKNEP